jgi:hypothetical protein
LGSKSNDAVLAAEGAFAFQNGHLQSKLIGVQQQLKEAAETVAQYMKGTLENSFF